MNFKILAAAAAICFAPTGCSSTMAADFGGMKDRAATVDVPDVITWGGLSVGVQVGVSNPTHELDVTERFEGETGVETVNLFHLDGLGNMGLNGRLFAQYDFEILSDFVIGARGWYGLGNSSVELGIFENAITAKIEEDDSYGGLVRLGRIVGAERRGLIYGLVGYGVINYEISSNMDISDFVNTDLEAKGLIAGGGLEYALSRAVFFSVEYQHLFADKQNVTKGDLADFLHADVTTDVDSVHAGLRVKF